MKNALICFMLFSSAAVWSQEEEVLPPPVEKPDEKKKTGYPPVEEPPRPPAKADPEQPYKFVDEPAEYPGGPGALRKYLTENLVYPASAEKAGIMGKCYLQFTVTAEGTIKDIKVARGVPDCPECDAEAVRLAGAMPPWIPGKVNGKPVDSRFNLPVVFKLN